MDNFLMVISGDNQVFDARFNPIEYSICWILHNFAVIINEESHDKTGYG